MAATSTATPCLDSLPATYPMRAMLVSRSSRLKPRPWQRLVRTSSPSSSSTRWPRSARAGASLAATVDLPAPDRPVSQSTKPVSLVMGRCAFRWCGRSGAVGVDQQLGHLGPGELGRGQLAGGQHGPHLGAGEGDVLAVGVGAGLAGGHGQAAPAVEGVVEAERGDAQVLGGQRGDQLLGLEGAVVAANAGVVAADDEVGAAVVLADQGVQDGLAGPGVA